MDTPIGLTNIVLTQKERPIDRYISSQTGNLEHNGQTITLFSTVEIISRWHPAREIGATLAQNFARFFSRSTHQSILTRFEDSLKSLNKQLFAANQKVDSPISCILSIHAGSEVYFSTIGSAKILLLRDGKLSNIAPRSKDDDLSEFSTVTSGGLSKKDWIFYVNKDLSGILRAIDPAKLKNCDEEQLTTLVKEQIALANGNNLTGNIVRLSEGESTTTTINLDELESRTPISLPKFAVPKFSMPKFKFSKPEEKPVPKPEITPDFDSPVINEYKANSAKVLQRINFGFFGSLIRDKRVIYGLIGLVVVVGVVIGFKMRHHSSPTTAATSNNSFVSDLSSKTAAEIISSLNQNLTADNYQKLSTTDLSQLSVLATQASLTIIPTSTATSTFTSPVSLVDFSAKDATLFTLDSTGQLWSGTGANLAKATQTTLIPNAVSIAALSKTNILVSDKNGNILHFDGTAVAQPITMPLPTGFNTGIKYLKKYGANVYILQPATGAISKITSFTNAIGTPAAYATSAAGTGTSFVDWDVNGTINLITPTSIAQAQKGKADKILNAKTTFSPQAKVTVTSTAIIVADGREISYFNLQGTLQQTKILVTNDPITDITSDGAIVYICAGTNIYQLP